ncbi:MAG TPA: NAD(P)H-dependent oxidoreductase [Acetobacteraceae bacterium]|jgi:chromate reductase|nr:NAD(P)H-dependent oxidoreductase [Acetobacteraceae bacterium]
MDGTIRVLGISGSLRAASWNTRTLHAARELAPPGVEVEVFGRMREIPVYDDDLRASQGHPPAVEALRGEIRAADAVLICSPEYNYSVPGMLKNALDWVSRPPDQPFDGKPVAIAGAATGLLGTARMQYDLRKIFVFLNAHVLNKPEVMIAQAPSRFDAEGRLTDETTRGMVAAQLAALRDWTLRLRR